MHARMQLFPIESATTVANMTPAGADVRKVPRDHDERMTSMILEATRALVSKGYFDTCTHACTLHITDEGLRV